MDVAQHEKVDQIVRGMIRHGTIAKREVARHFAGIPKAEYLDGSGTLLPVERLSTNSQAALLVWVGELESQAGGKKIADAARAAGAHAKVPCA